MSMKFVARWHVSIGSGNDLFNKGIICADVNPDLCSHKASVGFNELTEEIKMALIKHIQWK